MSQELRANTAVDVLIGPFVDDADGDTPITGSTLVVELSKNGQALATKNDVTSPTHDAAGTVDGYYNCELDTTDTNTEGQLVLVTHHADSLPIRHDYSVLSEAAWDSKYIAKDDGFMDINVKTIGRADTQETEANNLESACSNYSATRGLTGTSLPAAAADGVGGVPISDLGGLDLDTLFGALTDWIDGGRLDTLLDAIPTTAMRGTDGANTTVPDVAGTAPTAVEIQAEMEENGASLLDTIRDDLDNGTDGLGALKTLIDNLNDITTANVLTQVNAALDTAISELGVAAPTATPTLRTGLMLLYMTLRNRLDLDTGTNTKEIFNSAGTKITQKALTDDDTTYSEAKMA